MAINNPNDPRQATPGDDFNRRIPLDSELQADPEMAEGPASGGRIAIYAVAVLALLGVVFYGLNNNGTTNNAANTPAATTADSSSAPAVRDVTPNREPGTTTGAAPTAPAQPVQPPQAAPQGTQIDQNRGQPKE